MPNVKIISASAIGVKIELHQCLFFIVSSGTCLGKNAFDSSHFIPKYILPRGPVRPW